MILLCDRLRYRTVFVLTGFLVLLGIAVEHSGNYVIMTLGGFIAAFSDDALQVRTNTILQNMFPSEQRATLDLYGIFYIFHDHDRVVTAYRYSIFMVVIVTPVYLSYKK